MFVALTKMGFDPDVADEVKALALAARPIAERQPGIISFTQHVASDGNHIMTYWLWQSEQDHLNCMASEDWADFTPRWQKLTDAGKITFTLDTYTVLED